MGSALSETKTADQRTVLETGQIDQFAAPDSAQASGAASAYNLGMNAKLYNQIEGLSGADVNALATSIFADEQQDAAAMADLAKSAIGEMSSLATAAQASAGADWQKWLPFLVLAAVLLMYLGAQK